MSDNYEDAVKAVGAVLSGLATGTAPETAARIAVNAYLSYLGTKAEVRKPRFSEGRPGGIGDPMIEMAYSPVPVLQKWVQYLPLMQQTVLLTAIRGPDGIVKYSPVKPLLRWYRRCVLLSAMDRGVLLDPVDPRGGSFTGPSIVLDKDVDTKLAEKLLVERPRRAPGWQRAMDDVVGGYVEGLDAMPLHFHTHLMHGVQILGYKHPTVEIRDWWNGVYSRFCSQLHLYPEPAEDMNRRLSDNRDAWLERSDPATTA